MHFQSFNVMRGRILWLQGGAFCLGVIVVFTVSRQFPVMAGVAAAQTKIADLGLMGIFAYPALCAVCNLLLLPGGILSMGAGMFFGLWAGFLVVLGGNVLGAAIAFGLGRFAGRAWIEKHLPQNRKWAATDAIIARYGGRVVFLTQLHPLSPTSLFNYLYGVTRLKFWPCMGWIALGQAPGLFLYVYLGTLGQRGIQLVEGKTHPAFHEYVFWIGGFVVTVLIAVFFARLAREFLKKMESPEPPPPGDFIPIHPASSRCCRCARGFNRGKR